MRLGRFLVHDANVLGGVVARYFDVRSVGVTACAAGSTSFVDVSRRVAFHASLTMCDVALAYRSASTSSTKSKPRRVLLCS